MTNRTYHVLSSALAISLALAACAPAAAPTTAPAAQPTAAPTKPATTAVPPTAAPTATMAPTADPKADWPKKFTVGMFGGDDAEKTLRDNDPLRVYLEAQLGLPVELQTGTSYSAVIEAMRASRVDAMQVGPFSYTLAVQEANAEAVAVSITGSKDEPKYIPNSPTYYLSMIITKKGSGIRTLADLKGKDFAFVDPASTSGHLAPKTLLIKNGINPDTDMKTVFAGSHPTAVMSVWEGKTPAGATYEGNLYALAKEGQIEFCNFPDGEQAKIRTQAEIDAVYDACPDGNIVVIAISDPIPNTPFAVRGDLPQSFKDAVHTALLGIKDDAELVAALKAWYEDPTEQMGLANLDAFYNPLRDIAKLLNLDLKAMK